MATIKTITAVTPKQLLLAGAVLLAVASVVLLISYFMRPPQMGAHEGVFRSVDALFTAVTARDEKLLAKCEQRLHNFKSSGELPGDASNYLDGIIQTARSGSWESASESLYTFMMAQRRDGATAERPKHEIKRRRDLVRR